MESSQHGAWSSRPYLSSETPKPVKHEISECKLELPKKRWLREANLDTCRLMNQSRPTVLVRVDSCPVSPPWTPIHTSTPVVVPPTRTPSNSMVPPILTPDSTVPPILTPPDSTVPPLFTAPDSTDYLNISSDDEYAFYLTADEELACPLPSEDETNISHPLNLSQNSLIDY